MTLIVAAGMPAWPWCLRARMVRRGFLLEYVTLGWNVAGIIVLAVAAAAARSVATDSRAPAARSGAAVRPCA